MKQVNYWNLLMDGVPKTIKIRNDRFGTKYGRLTISSRIAFKKSKHKGGIYYYYASCSCNSNNKSYAYTALCSGDTKSCGCIYNESRWKAVNNIDCGNKKHGLSHTKLYKRWHKIMSRCCIETDDNYYNYGDRNIKVCNEWYNFQNFHDWAISSGYKPELEVDRIDVNGNYCPENCRWVTPHQNSMNRRGNLDTSSKYKGVCWANREKLWRSTITLNYKQVSLGYFKHEKDAAIAYNKKALELFGEFAFLNEID